MKYSPMLAQYWANVADADNTKTTLHECILELELGLIPDQFRN